MTNFKAFYRAVKAEAGTCFVGANTPSGFVADWQQHISEDELRRFYIIKGGSGTGKSTLMRRCAEAARSAGAVCTQLYCGSDPDSLDAVIFEKNGVRSAMADGTAPHLLDPKYAGACGEIINCGEFWKTRALTAQKEKIAALSASKNVCFLRCYNYLSAARRILDSQETAAVSAVQEEKLRRFLRRLSASLGREKQPHMLSYARTEAITMKGAVRLLSFENAPRLFGIENYAFLYPYFMQELLSALKDSFTVVVSQDPLGGIAEILLPVCGIAFVPQREGVTYEKVIRLRRFADDELLHEYGSRRRFASKCLGSLTDGALDCLAEAGEYHRRLEEIYSSQMDFSSLDKLTEQLSQRIIRELE